MCILICHEPKTKGKKEAGYKDQLGFSGAQSARRAILKDKSRALKTTIRENVGQINYPRTSLLIAFAVCQVKLGVVLVDRSIKADNDIFITALRLCAGIISL